MPADPDKHHRIGQLRQMLLIRRFEEKAAELYSATKIRGFLHLYIGEEAVAVGVMAAFDAEDAVVATYREHGQALARGMSANSIMAEMYGKHGGLLPGPWRFDASRSTRQLVFTAATPLSPAACRWRWAWPWPTRCRGATG